MNWINKAMQHMNIRMNGGSVSINGQTFSGRNISIVGSRVMVDGVEQAGEPLVGPITVNVVGGCESLELGAGDAYIQGSVGGDVRTGSGDVKCGDVSGSVSTGSGDVSCGQVGGGVRTGSGDIIQRR